MLTESPELINKNKIESTSFCTLNTLNLYQPPNWHKYFLQDKQYFSISEIVFIRKEDNFNSFIRKNIIIDQNLNISCNILGKNIDKNKLINVVNKVESHKQLDALIK